MLSKKAINWLKDHEDLIRTLSNVQELDTFISKIPAEFAHEIIDALQSISIDFVENDDSEHMWGIKSADGRYTLSARKFNGSTYNTSMTSSQGMKGGYQVGFKTFKDALAYCSNHPQSSLKLRPARMQPKTVTQYKWTEVDTICGKAYFSDAALKQYDPSPQNQNRKKYDKALDVLLNGFNLRSNYTVKDIISKITGNKYVVVFSHVDVDSDKYVVSFSDLYATERQLRDILLELNSRFKREFKREKTSKENRITLSSALPQSLKNEIEELKNKYEV